MEAKEKMGVVFKHKHDFTTIVLSYVHHGTRL